MEVTIVHVTQGNVQILDMEEWESTFSDWITPEDLAIGQSTVFIVTRTA